MDRLIDKIAQDQNLAATTQTKIRNNRRIVRRNLTPPIEPTGIYPQQNDDGNNGIDDDEPIVIAPALPAVTAPSAATMLTPHSAITSSPLDLPADQFRSGLNRRKQNRQMLMDWLWWLHSARPTTEYVDALIASAQLEFSHYAVSTRLNNAKNDDEELVSPA